MSPKFSTQNIVDGAKVDPVLHGQLPLSYSSIGVEFSNFKNTAICKNMMWMLLTHLWFWVSPSSLFLSIKNVLMFGSQEQVSRITASWIITFMQDAKRLFAHWICQQIRNPVSNTWALIKHDASILSTITSHPRPAVVLSKDTNFGPKSGLFVLFKNLNGYNLRLHRSLSLICATLPARQSAGAFSLMMPIS